MKSRRLMINSSRLLQLALVILLISCAKSLERCKDEAGKDKIEKSEECVSKYKDEKVINGEKVPQWKFIVPANPENGRTLSSELMDNEDSYEETKKALDNLVKHFESVHLEQTDRNDSFQNASPDEQGDMDEVCQLGIDPRIKNRAMFYGFGFPNDCGFWFKGWDGKNKDKIKKKPELKASFVTNNIIKYVEGLEKAKDKTVKNYGLDWNTTFVNDIMVRDAEEDFVRRCTAYRAMAFRVNGKWSIAGKLAKRPFDYYAPTKDKEILSEFILVDDNGLKPQKLTIPQCNDCSVKTGLTEATASLWFGRQNDDWGYFWEKYHRDLRRHDAMKQILSDSNHDKELVEDSAAISNAAILILPVVLTLLPLGFFQEVSARFLMLYSLVTDVFSCLPIIIRGIELLVVGNTKYHTISSKWYGLANKKDLVVSQVWTAKCTVSPDIRSRGNGFLIFGICAMLFGLGLEFLTFVLTKRAKQRLQEIKDDAAKDDKEIDILDKESDNVGLFWYLKHKI